MTSNMRRSPRFGSPQHRLHQQSRPGPTRPKPFRSVLGWRPPYLHDIWPYENVFLPPRCSVRVQVICPPCRLQEYRDPLSLQDIVIASRGLFFELLSEILDLFTQAVKNQIHQVHGRTT